VKLGRAADIITQHPVALLRTLKTTAEISKELNHHFSGTIHDDGAGSRQVIGVRFGSEIVRKYIEDAGGKNWRHAVRS
jgi:hypothetical protein